MPSLRLALLALPLVFLIVGALYPDRAYHWDTLERASLLENPGRYWKSWDGTPRSQILSFAHVLELPLAGLVSVVVPGPQLRALIALELIASAVALFVIGAIVLFWRRAVAAPRGALLAAIAAQAVVAASLAFWKMGTSGQEKSLALATQVLFLFAFWRALAAAGPGTRPEVAPSRGIDFAVAGSLALAVLAHLSGAVVVPFALLALVRVPAAWKPNRGRVLRSVLWGSVATGILYWIVAAVTTGVRGPGSFIDYLTFFHRADGINFFEPTGTPAAPGSRLGNGIAGLGAFFSGEPWVGKLTAALLLLAAIGTRWWSGPSTLRRTLYEHALLLGALWTAHFLYFEPLNHESWTLVAALLVIVGSVALPVTRAAVAAFGLPLLLLATNQRHYVAGHAPLEHEGYRRALERASRPGDIVLLVGGMQNDRSLQGSLWMRYFLATLPDRVAVSLYDVMGVTQEEYWGRPFPTPASLQAAIDDGRRTWMPAALQKDLDRAVQSGLVRIETVAAGDSLLEVRRIEAVPAP